MSTVKVGVLGGGGILDAHMRGYRAYADAIKVTAVADLVEDTARRRAAELDAAAYTDFRQMILDADIDASTSACRITFTPRPSWPRLRQVSTSCARSRSV